jgi:hypothetical protein
MDKSIRNLLGLNSDHKRVYQISESQSEVSREEFAYSQLMFKVVFGDKGYTETLGPTWRMVHDPRFMEVEGCFVIDRPAIFGGDSRLGKQYFDDRGVFTSTVNDLEQYAEILAEGRHFQLSLYSNEVSKILHETHEGTKFKVPVIATGEAQDFKPKHYTDALSIMKKKQNILHAPLELLKQLSPAEQTIVKTHAEHNLAYVAPHTWSDDEIWAFLKDTDNIPNYFDQKGNPNKLANVLFNAIRVGLIGLVSSYAPLPNVEEWVTLDGGDVVTAADADNNELQKVWLEVDLLEKALSYRASLRVTAAKILDSQTIRRFLKMCNMEVKDIKLTDVERDQLLEIVYTSEYPDKQHELFLKINEFLAKCLSKPIDTREVAQLVKEREQASTHTQALRDGTLKSISSYTEPTIDLPETDEERCVRDIIENPLRQELYMLFVNVEKRHLDEVAELLRPAATDPHIVVDEEYFAKLMDVVYPMLPETVATELDAVLATAEEKLVGKAGNHEVTETPSIDVE